MKIVSLSSSADDMYLCLTVLFKHKGQYSKVEEEKKDVR